MPRARLHRPVGALVGLLVTALERAGERGGPVAAEVVGGGVGGYIGGAMPDFIDVPTSPIHRSVAHSVELMVTGIVAANRYLSDICQALRTEGEEQQGLAARATDPISRALHLGVAIVLRFMAGLVGGFAWGYASHLALDACTANGLPVLVAR